MERQSGLTNSCYRLNEAGRAEWVIPNSQHVVSWGCYLEAAQKFVMSVTIFAREWGQKTSLTK